MKSTTTTYQVNSTPHIDTTEADSIRAMAIDACSPNFAGYPADGESAPYVVVPPGHAVYGLEDLFPSPLRKRGTVVANDAASFCAVVLDQKTDGTRLYGDVNPPRFTAVFNDHFARGAGWRDHRATYACPLSPEWTIWTGANKRTMTQEAFAQFIEDNAPDCVAPDSATMIEISRTLEAKKKVNFASGIRLSNGQSELTYEEEITGTAGKGKLQIPETFQIGIAVLQGGPRYAVVARLRYRIQDKGQLVLWFDLDRPHKVIEDAARDVWDKVQADTGLKIINGRPE